MLADGRILRVGSASWFGEYGLVPIAKTQGNAASRVAASRVAASHVEVAVDDTVIGAIELAEPLRAESAAIIARLEQRGLKILLASGDGAGPVEAAASQLGIEGRAGMRPDDKLGLIEQLQAEGRCVAFVGDGLNDGPALAAADLGIAVGNANDLA